MTLWSLFYNVWIDQQKIIITSNDTCVTVSGHSPLSRPVAWRRSSSPIGLGYQHYASTHLLNALQMVALRAAI